MSEPFQTIFRVAGYVVQGVLSPVLVGTTLAAIEFAPDQVRGLIRQWFAKTVSQSDLEFLKGPLKILLALGFVRSTNNALSAWAANNWRMTAHSGWVWDNEIAVVTGGCSGIGQKVVEGLAKRGVRVAVFDIQALPASMRENKKIRYYQCDVTDPASVAKAADAVRRDLGHPTVLVNNAGITNKDSTILESNPAAITRIFQINCISHWTTVQQFLPNMIKQDKGHIVSVASLASFVALPMHADYACTKAGALAFHEALAGEIKHAHKAQGVMTSIVHPNFVKTPLLSDEQQAAVERFSGKLLTADEVANPLLNQIFARRGAQVIVPSEMGRVSGLRGLSTWVQELIRDRVGKGIAKNYDARVVAGKN